MTLGVTRRATRFLRELAARFRRKTRARYGLSLGRRGVPIPYAGTSLLAASQIGVRMRHSIAAEPFQINRDGKIAVTASVGIASLDGVHDSLERLRAAGRCGPLCRQTGGMQPRGGRRGLAGEPAGLLI